MSSTACTNGWSYHGRGITEHALSDTSDVAFLATLELKITRGDKTGQWVGSESSSSIHFSSFGCYRKASQIGRRAIVSHSLSVKTPLHGCLLFVCGTAAGAPAVELSISPEHSRPERIPLAAGVVFTSFHLFFLGSLRVLFG